MSPSFKAALAFHKDYPKAIDMTDADYNAVLLSWWEANKEAHPRATFEGLKGSTDATLAYNRDYPLRK